MPAAAQIAPTPDGWKPEQARAKADAYIAEQIAVFTRKAPANDIKLALRRVQMVRPDEPTVTNQLAFYVGEGQPDQFYNEILAFRPDEPVATYYLAQKLSDEGYVNLALPFYAVPASFSAWARAAGKRSSNSTGTPVAVGSATSGGSTAAAAPPVVTCRKARRFIPSMVASLPSRPAPSC